MPGSNEFYSSDAATENVGRLDVKPVSMPHAKLSATSTYTSRLRRSDLLHLAPLVPTFPREPDTHLQRRTDGARSTSPRARAAIATPLPPTIRMV